MLRKQEFFYYYKYKEKLRLERMDVFHLVMKYLYGKYCPGHAEKLL